VLAANTPALHKQAAVGVGSGDSAQANSPAIPDGESPTSPISEDDSDDEDGNDDGDGDGDDDDEDVSEEALRTLSPPHSQTSHLQKQGSPVGADGFSVRVPMAKPKRGPGRAVPVEPAVDVRATQEASTVPKPKKRAIHIPRDYADDEAFTQSTLQANSLVAQNDPYDPPPQQKKRVRRRAAQFTLDLFEGTGTATRSEPWSRQAAQTRLNAEGISGQQHVDEGRAVKQSRSSISDPRQAETKLATEKLDTSGKDKEESREDIVEAALRLAMAFSSFDDGVTDNSL